MTTLYGVSLVMDAGRTILPLKGSISNPEIYTYSKEELLDTDIEKVKTATVAFLMCMNNLCRVDKVVVSCKINRRSNSFRIAEYSLQEFFSSYLCGKKTDENIATWVNSLIKESNTDEKESSNVVNISTFTQQ